MMVALRDCMPMTSWLVLTMYFCFFCLTCRYVIEGPCVLSFPCSACVIFFSIGWIRFVSMGKKAKLLRSVIIRRGG